MPVLLNAVAIITGLGMLVCFIMVLIKVFQDGKTALGIISIVAPFCCGIGHIIALIVGWQNADRWRSRNLMVIYSILFAVNLLVSVPLIMQSIRAVQQAAIEQQQTQQGTMDFGPGPEMDLGEGIDDFDTIDEGESIEPAPDIDAPAEPAPDVEETPDEPAPTP